MLKDSTAAELAEMLDQVPYFQRSTGTLSMLDEATMAFGNRDQETGEAQRAFAEARHEYHWSYMQTGKFSDDAWETVKRAAARLAELLRPLGDFRIPRCDREAGWGACGLPLADDGTCRSSMEHKD